MAALFAGLAIACVIAVALLVFDEIADGLKRIFIGLRTELFPFEVLFVIFSACAIGAWAL